MGRCPAAQITYPVTFADAGHDNLSLLEPDVILVPSKSSPNPPHAVRHPPTWNGSIQIAAGTESQKRRHSLSHYYCCALQPQTTLHIGLGGGEVAEVALAMGVGGKDHREDWKLLGRKRRGAIGASAGGEQRKVRCKTHGRENKACCGLA